MITYLCFYLTLVIKILLEVLGMFIDNNKSHKVMSAGGLAQSVIHKPVTRSQTREKTSVPVTNPYDVSESVPNEIVEDNIKLFVSNCI